MKVYNFSYSIPKRILVKVSTVFLLDRIFHVGGLVRGKDSGFPHVPIKFSSYTITCRTGTELQSKRLRLLNLIHILIPLGSQSYTISIVITAENSLK